MESSTTEHESELTLNARALAPDYKVLGELGRGGMGIVYLAIDVNLDREVAVKVLPAHLTEPLGVRDRFLREARTAAKLTHPNIVPFTGPMKNTTPSDPSLERRPAAAATADQHRAAQQADDHSR